MEIVMEIVDKMNQRMGDEMQYMRGNIIDRNRRMERGLSKGANYKFSQMFGYKGPNQKIMEEDIISNIKFDRTGKYLALGDKAGRIIVFEAPENKKNQQLEYYAEFQSHLREFDALHSMEVEEEIVGINWLSNQGRYLKLLSTNVKNIKLWKVYEKAEKKIIKSNTKELVVPKLQTIQSSLVASVQYNFPAKHLSPINSVNCTLNEEYMLSTDDAHAFLWSMHKSTNPYIVADMLRGQKIEDIKESITCSKMHPTSDSLFLYGTNKGSICLSDLRVSCSFDTNTQSIKADSLTTQKNFFSEMLSSVSSVEFMRQGRNIITRDYLTVKVWDVCNMKKPLQSVVIQEALKGKLCQLFEHDCMQDKFQISASSDGSTLLTGNYNNSFHLIDANDGANTQYQLNYKKNTTTKNVAAGKGPLIPKMDFLRKAVAVDFHPKKNTLAVATLNCFFIYSA